MDIQNLSKSVSTGFMESVKNSLIAKTILILILILLLQFPIFRIDNLIGERQQTRQGAVNEVTSKWGKSQTIIGPSIVVPYLKRWEEINNDGKKIPRSEITFATFLPETLNISGNIDSEIRHRGIYEVPVYKMSLNLNGQFTRPDFDQWKIPQEDVLWHRAYLVVYISDTRAIIEQSSLSWNGENLEFLPSSGDFGHNQPGIHARMKGFLDGDNFDYSIPLVLNGSVEAFFTPFGKETVVTLNSNWNAPSFQGTWLPTERSVKEEGFDAKWNIPYLGRNYPQNWCSSFNYNGLITSNIFGVRLLTEMDHYLMSKRSVKYHFLFVLLTFTTLWLFEVLTGAKIHIIQYMFVGAGMCMFYLLELSLSEHIGFNGAYAIAGLMIVLLLAFYCYSVLKTGTRAFLMGLLVTLLYTFLYILLTIQEFALLIGSLALFTVLALVMYLTRNINWDSTINKATRGITDIGANK